MKKSSNTAALLGVIALQPALVAAAAIRSVDVILPAVIVAAVLVALVMVAITGMAMFGNAAIGVQHAAIRQMGMVVVVAVDRQRLGGTAAEQFQIFRALADHLRRATAADMAVEADHRIGLGHHHMQVVGDQQDTAAGPVADRFDQIVKRNLAGKIDALHRLVEDEQIRFAGNGTGKQGALELAAGEMLHLGAGKMGNAGRMQRFLDLAALQRARSASSAAPRSKAASSRSKASAARSRTFSPGIFSTQPSSGFKTPIAAFAVVDLPEPLGPISVTISPLLIEKLDAAHQPAAIAADAGIGERDERCLVGLVRIQHQKNPDGVLPAAMPHVIA